MKTLNFTPEQTEILKETLSSYLSDLRMEIVDTDNSEFREKLKKKKKVLNETLAMLKEE
ncbi:MAG: hypothetical protein QM500_03300 [Methylococcales bacterium]